MFRTIGAELVACLLMSSFVMNRCWSRRPAHDFREIGVIPRMVDPLGTDQGEENSSTKGNFVGRVVNSEATSQEYGGDSRYRDEDSDYFDHLYEIEVLSEDWDNIHEFSLEVNNNFESKWMLFVGHLQSIHGHLSSEQGLESLQDIAEFMEGRVYEFREIGFTEDEVFEYPGVDQKVNLMKMFSGGENAPNPLIVPVREVTDEDELAEYEGGSSTTIDEDVQL
jgi:hypothetical protein